MAYIAIGGDVSKGRLDIAILNESGTRLHAGCYDDTSEGHAQVARVVDEVRRRQPGAALLVGLESTGGMERNWLAFFRRIDGARVHRLNATAVKRHLAAELHRAVTDAHAADGIARYLLERVRDRRVRDDAPPAAVAFYRSLRSAMQRRVEVDQQLHALLIQVHPELVQYCRSGFRDWMIDLLERYPTAQHLARARPEGLAQLPFAARSRADSLVAGARATVAGLTGDGAAAAVALIIRQRRDLDAAIADGQRALSALVAADPLHARQVRLLATIPGIGEWTATILSLELGDLKRFDSDRALIAWSGLDPHEDRSGDGVVRRGISHRGNADVRRALFMPALTAAQRNVAVAALWERLIARGKPRLVAAVACMNKLLRIAYAIVVSGRDFDPQHEERRRAAAHGQQRERSTNAPATPATTTSAPITRAEARRRNNAAAPCSEERRQSAKANAGAAASTSVSPPAHGPAPTA
jgi:transposase